MKNINKQQIVVAIIAGMISCNKPNPPETVLEPYKINLQFVDYTTGDPISNLQVKRWNYQESVNRGVYIAYKDSFLTDAGGNTHFEPSEIDDNISWSATDYFDDYYHIVPGTKLPRTSSLNMVKTEGNIRYYQAKLFPKIEVTIHIK